MVYETGFYAEEGGENNYKKSDCLPENSKITGGRHDSRMRWLRERFFFALFCVVLH